MSTRATYKVITELTETTFYIHHDGYPEGASEYFQNALKSDRRGSFADRFHNANERAEITLSHNAHGDTEYRYDIRTSGDEIVVMAMATSWDSDKGEVVFNGTLTEFIAKYK